MTGNKFDSAFLCGYEEAINDIIRQLRIVQEKSGDEIEIDEVVEIAETNLTRERLHTMASAGTETYEKIARRVKAGYYD